MNERGYLLYNNGEKECFPEGISILSGYKNNDSIVEVMIPDSVLVIDNNAFTSCGNLRKVLCNPESSKLIHIGDLAFHRCFELQEFQIPDSITTVGGFAFSGTKLSIMDFSNSKLRFLGPCAFEMCSKLMKVHLKFVDLIPLRCFSFCSELMSVAGVSDSCYVGERAFEKCGNLTQFTTLSPSTKIESGNDPLKPLCTF